MSRRRFPNSMFKVCLKKEYEEKGIIHCKNSEKDSKRVKSCPKLGKVPNTPKLKEKILSIIQN